MVLLNQKKQEKSQTVTIAVFEENAIVEPRCSSSEENNDDLDNSEQDATGHLSVEKQESENANGNKMAKAVTPLAKFKMSGKNRQSRKKHKLNPDKVNLTSSLTDQ